MSNIKVRKLKNNKVITALIIFVVFLLLVVAGAVFSFGFSSGNKGEAVVYPNQFSYRDTYYLGTEDQGDFGNCWAFANTKAMEIMLAQLTGEHFELNEPYTVSTRLVGREGGYSEQLIGAGGSVQDFIDAINGNGFVLDSDMGYEDMYYINGDNNQTILDILSKKADKHTLYIDDVDTYYYKDNAEIIKYYITNNKNCTINITNWELVYNNGHRELVPGGYGAHSLFIMGWDDNYITTTGTRGAYLVLNSYGVGDEYGKAEDGIIYLPYRTTLGYHDVAVFSYDITLPDDYVSLTSNATYQVNTKGKYFASTNYTGSPFNLADRNIFAVDQDYQLEYTFPSLENLEYSVNVYKGDQNISDQFYIIKDTRSCKVYKRANLASGSYKIAIDYSYSRQGRATQRHILKQLFLLDGLEYTTVQTYNEENTSHLTNVAVDSFSRADDTIVVPQYAATTRGEFVMIMQLSPYSNVKSFSLQKDGILQSQTVDEGAYSIRLMCSRTVLTAKENVLTLTLKNDKYTKSIKIVVNQADGVYGGEGSINTKFTTFLMVDLDGGEVSQNFADRISLTTANGYFERYNIPQIPQKEGYIFSGYEYKKSDGTWESLSTFYYTNASEVTNEKKTYFITSDNVVHCTAKNFYTYTRANYNYKNTVFLRALYEKAPAEIALTSAGQSGNSFDVDKNITASLSISGTNIVWQIDGTTVGNGQSLNLGSFKSGKHTICAIFTFGSTRYRVQKEFYIKYHKYVVEVDNVVFTYNKALQIPNVTINGLVEGSDYTLQKPSSIEAGTYQITINAQNNIILSQRTVNYVINKIALDLSFDNQIIKQGQESLLSPTFTYTCTNWLEDQPLNITFSDTRLVNVWEVGQYTIGFTITNLPSSYDISNVEAPMVVVVEANFDTSHIDLITQTATSEKSQTFKYGQRFVINFDCPSGMIKTVEYQLNGKTYRSKSQYISERLPVGNYTIKGSATLANGEQIQKSIDIEIVPLSVRVVLDNKQSIRGQQPSKLTYRVVSDYSAPDLVVTPYIRDFDRDTLGDYVISAKVTSNNIENYEIDIIEGVYSVVNDNAQVNTILIIVFSIIAILLVGFIIIRRRIKNKKEN